MRLPWITAGFVLGFIASVGAQEPVEPLLDSVAICPPCPPCAGEPAPDYQQQALDALLLIEQAEKKSDNLDVMLEELVIEEE
jgi:hypothetical protein